MPEKSRQQSARKTSAARRARLPRVEITQQERERLLALVEAARRDDAADTVLASLAAKLKAGGGPSFARYSELLESGGEPDPAIAARVREAAAAGATVGVGLLPRRGAIVRCLASDAPALVSAISRVWNAARREVLALPPVDLRKS